MKPVLALGLILLASEPLTLGDLGRAADVARARVDACEDEPSTCTSPAMLVELARAMAVLYAESMDRPADATALYTDFLSRAPARHPARERAQKWVDDHAAGKGEASPRAQQ